MKLKLVPGEWVPNWYCIERAEHNGGMGLRPIHGGVAIWMACRLGNADVEGTLGEMRSIAKAIRDGSTYTAKRCAVNAEDQHNVQFWSPRNSDGKDHEPVTIEEALDLARQIEAVQPQGEANV